ncbi:MAG: GNAT family N-acetyltransferase [Bacteroidales bacterium]
MIEFYENEKIDLEKWDECIERSINGIIYPYSYYLNQVSPGWCALILNDYEAVMPLPVKKKWGVNYIMQPVFVQQLGVFSPDTVHEEQLHEFIAAIPSKYKFINLNLNTYNQFKSNTSKISVSRRRTYELDLISPYEKLFANYSTNAKRNLKKAEKAKVFVTRNSEPQNIIDLFRQNKGKDFKMLNNQIYEMLRHLAYSSIHRGNAIAYAAFSSNNTLCAGVIFFHSHKKSVLIFSGNNEEAKKNGAMTAIIDHYIRDYAGQNITLDFEGSNNESLARFYSSFGSKECVYLQLRINKFPVIIQTLVNFYSSYKAKKAQ